MIKRDLEKSLRRLAGKYPVVTVTGPRQSGKTTLCRHVFARKPYVSLETPDARRRAVSDPRRFLREFPDGAVLDEIQRAPDLLSYIQTDVDEHGREGTFILTGSRQLALMDSVSQSLAGRTALVVLLPFSFGELYGGRKIPSIEEILYTGFYPRIFDRKLNPTEALSFYMSTYVERDVRSVLDVKDLSRFEIFVKSCAARTGQILNLSSLAADCGINHNTARSWLSVLQACYIVTLVPPHFRNFNKRLIKSPKLYFVDVGLAAYLIEIENPRQLRRHPLRGALFETFVVSEILKQRFNAVRSSHLYYFRDNIGNEIDLVLESAGGVSAVEIKAGETVADDFFKGLRYYKKINPSGAKRMALIYGGRTSHKEKNVEVISFRDLAATGL